MVVSGLPRPLSIRSQEETIKEVIHLGVRGTRWGENHCKLHHLYPSNWEKRYKCYVTWPHYPTGPIWPKDHRPMVYRLGVGLAWTQGLGHLGGHQKIGAQVTFPTTTSTPPAAQTPGEVQTLRQQIQEMRQDILTRLDRLERDQAEFRQAQTQMMQAITLLAQSQASNYSNPNNESNNSGSTPASSPTSSPSKTPQLQLLLLDLPYLKSSQLTHLRKS